MSVQHLIKILFPKVMQQILVLKLLILKLQKFMEKRTLFFIFKHS